MNEGFIAYWLLTIAVILYWTGWKELVAERISGRSMLALLVSAMLLQPLTLTLGSYTSVRGSAIVAVGAAAVAVACISRASQALYVLASAVMTSFVWLWIRLMYASDPVFVLLQPDWDSPLVAGLISGILTERLRWQFIASVSAAIAGQFTGLFGPGYGPNIVILGSPGWWDGLAIALVAARLTGLAKHLLRRAAARLSGGSPEERGGSL